MSGGSFTPFGSPWNADHAARRLQEHHQERKAQEAAQNRATRWIAAQMAGLTFTSLESLTEAATSAATAHHAAPLTEAQLVLIQRSCVALFCGMVDRAYFLGRLKITRGERIEFLRAG